MHSYVVIPNCTKTEVHFLCSCACVFFFPLTKHKKLWALMHWPKEQLCASPWKSQHPKITTLHSCATHHRERRLWTYHESVVMQPYYVSRVIAWSNHYLLNHRSSVSGDQFMVICNWFTWLTIFLVLYRFKLLCWCLEGVRCLLV